MMRCGDTRCTVSCIASQAPLVLELVKDGLGCCMLGGRWYLPEVQGGFREPHAPLVDLSGKRAVQVTVELVGPCSCQFSGLPASHACAYGESRRQAGMCSPSKSSSVS